MPNSTIVAAHARAIIATPSELSTIGRPLPPCASGSARPTNPRSARPLRFSFIGSLVATRPPSRITPISSTCFALPMPLGERSQPITQSGGLGVRVAERSAEERREAEAEHRAEVALGRRAQHAVVEAAHRLVHEQRRQSLGR